MHKSRQFCSVCKDWLEMEVVPTGDGEDDDGVIWFRCPQCQGFLPKLSGGDPAAGEETVTGASTGDDAAEPEVADETSDLDIAPDLDDPLVAVVAESQPETDGGGEDKKAEGQKAEGHEAEPIAEYAALLAEVDVDNPAPYRPWDTYEVGQCITHLAWNDCGVVVAKEELPGGRRIIKVFFSEAGVVRLIEQAPK